jgi:23S rRNA (adenine-N6)-dimethyltransferase
MSSNPPTLAYLILQEEAAYKFIGKPRETQMSLLLKPYFNMKVIERLKRSDFLPKPRVKTVFIEIERLNKSYLTDKEYIEYRDFIVYATTQWKATITDSLKEVLTKEQMKRLSQQIGFDSNSKPLDVCFVQWFELYKYFHTEVDQVKRAKVYGSYKRQLNLQKGLKKVYRTR